MLVIQVGEDDPGESQDQRSIVATALDTPVSLNLSF